MLVQPSLTTNECVFSLLNSGFGDQQEQSLQDYIEDSIILYIYYIVCNQIHLVQYHVSKW